MTIRMFRQFVDFSFADSLRAIIISRCCNFYYIDSSLKIHLGYVSISSRLDSYDAGMIFHYEGNVNIIVAC